MDQLTALPTWAQIALALYVVFQISLEVYAVVDIVRRPADRINGPKALWIAIALLVNLIGAIVYFAVGRKPAPAVDAPSQTLGDEVARDAVDTLYGPGDAR